LALLAAATPASALEPDLIGDFASSSNASDPSAYRCHNPNGTGSLGWCLTTSKDRNESPYNAHGPAENYYPMSETLTFFSTDGIKWGAPQTGVDEDDLYRAIPYLGWRNLEGNNHQWAPAVRYLQTPGGRAEWPINNYFMYTPNLLEKADKYSSRIWMTYSTNPSTGFGQTTIPHDTWQDETKLIEGVPENTTGFIEKYPMYMSDPDVFTDSSASDYYSLANVNKDYLIWADGDNATCGGISMRKMTNQWTVEAFTDPNQAWLPINGLNEGPEALGSCSKNYKGAVNQSIGRPYLEGASLFHSNRWSASKTSEGLPGPYVLVFAAKPTLVPEPCKSTYGETNSTNEVIAYATATNVKGPYAYQGIIMCGSESEWTNQATIEEVKALDGSSRLVLIYHDGPKDGNRNRQLHAECLYAINGKFVKTMRSTDGVASVSGAKNWCLKRAEVVALKSRSVGKYVTVKDDGLEASSTYIGPYEQFSFEDRDGDEVEINARRTGLYTGPSTTKIPATVDPRANITWTLEHVSGTAYRIKGEDDRYLRTASSGRVYSGSKNPSSTDTSYDFWVEALSN